MDPATGLSRYPDQPTPTNFQFGPHQWLDGQPVLKPSMYWTTRGPPPLHLQGSHLDGCRFVLVSRRSSADWFSALVMNRMRVAKAGNSRCIDRSSLSVSEAFGYSPRQTSRSIRSSQDDPQTGPCGLQLTRAQGRRRQNRPKEGEREK